jgi:hypothetical protein
VAGGREKKGEEGTTQESSITSDGIQSLSPGCSTSVVGFNTSGRLAGKVGVQSQM